MNDPKLAICSLRNFTSYDIFILSSFQVVNDLCCVGVMYSGE